MRRIGQGLVLALALWLMILSGCKSTQQNLKPPKPPEEFVVPPDEKRYSDPIEYPKDSLNPDKQIYNKPIDTPGGPGGGKGGPGGGMKGGGGGVGGPGS